jgi:hypothetical protein
MNKVTNVVVVLSAFVGGLIANDAYRNKQIVRNLPKLEDVLSHLDRMDESLAKITVTRCMNITTPSLSIYQVPNVGVMKLPPPGGN